MVAEYYWLDPVTLRVQVGDEADMRAHRQSAEALDATLPITSHPLESNKGKMMNSLFWRDGGGWACAGLKVDREPDRELMLSRIGKTLADVKELDAKWS